MDAHLQLVSGRRQWDVERLKDIQSSPTQSTTVSGSKCDYRVIQKVQSHLRQCQCTSQLLQHLRHRGILTEADCRDISQYEGSRRQERFVRTLAKFSADPNKSDQLIHGLYLSLLDCYEDDVNEWCWKTAVYHLRSAVIQERGIIQENCMDVKIAIRYLPSAQLSAAVVAQLIDHLSLRDAVRSTAINLHHLAQCCLSARSTLSLQDMVSALLLTPSLGRYVTYLTPHFQSNCPEVYKFLFHIKHSWRELAAYLGYTNQEVSTIATAGRGNVAVEIQLFLRVWWMPNLGQNETTQILQSLQPVLHLRIQERQNQVQRQGYSLEPVRSSQTLGNGQDLLRACMSNDWSKAEQLIKSGSNLEGHSEDGKTSLMYACLKGNDRIVQLLIECGANPEAMDNRGNCCLHFPDILRNQVLLQCLLEHYVKKGLSVDPESLDNGCTPLSIACKCEALKSAEILLQYNANPNGSHRGHYRPLVEASARGHIALVKLMLTYKADIDLTDNKGYTPLLQACTSKNWSVAELLICEGANVNRCGQDCTGPLFAAISGNSYSTASELIKKGAAVDAVRYQTGAQEGTTVEFTPLAHAARNGMTDMVDLMINSGANVNYLCSGTLPAIAFSIIGSQYETFNQLLACPSLDHSLLGLAAPIITSVRSEAYFFTEILLKELGGPEEALRKAEQNKMAMLQEHIVMYIQTMQIMGNQPPEQPCSALQKQNLIKVEETLYHFSQICVSAFIESQELQHHSVVEAVYATHPGVAEFLQRVISHTQRPEDLKQDFLQGNPSPLTFLIQNDILRADTFQMEALKFYTEGADTFYKDLLWTFHQMPGGEGLPNDIQATLTQLFNGNFVPNVHSNSRTRTAAVPLSKPAIAPPPPRRELGHPSIVQSNNSAVKLGHMCTSVKNMYTKLLSINHLLPARHSQLAERVSIKPSHLKGIEDSSLRSLPRMTEVFSDKSIVHPRFLAGDSREHNVAVVEAIKANNHQDSTNTDHDESDEVVTPNKETSSLLYVKPPEPDRHKAFINVAITSNQPLSAAYPSPLQHNSKLLPQSSKVRPTGEQLGFGSYGEVLEVEYKGKIYAAKKFKNADPPRIFRVFGRELQILALTEHVNIVPFCGICQLTTDGATVIVMEKMATNLGNFLEQSQRTILLTQKIKILSDVMNGLGYLHSLKPAIIHRDLTASNVLLDSNAVAKIADFGNSRMVDITATPELMTGHPGTLDYMSPEAMEGGVYSEKLDIFSLGHLAIYTIIQQRPHPLHGSKYYQDGKPIARTEVQRRIDFLEKVKKYLKTSSHPLLSLITDCLHDIPDRRPNCQKILEVLDICANI